MHLHELHQLSQLIVEIGDCFMVRRTMQCLEAKEMLAGGHRAAEVIVESRLSLSAWV